MALLALETEFWMRLKTSDSFSADLEWSYLANTEEMTENYSRNFFPPMILNPEDEG